MFSVIACKRDKFAIFSPLMMHCVEKQPYQPVEQKIHFGTDTFKSTCSDPQPHFPNFFQTFGDFGNRRWVIFRRLYVWRGTCGLVEKCRTHNTKVVSSSPATANVLWTWANHFTFLASLTRVTFGSCLRGISQSKCW